MENERKKVFLQKEKNYVKNNVNNFSETEAFSFVPFDIVKYKDNNAKKSRIKNENKNTIIEIYDNIIKTLVYNYDTESVNKIKSKIYNTSYNLNICMEKYKILTHSNKINYFLLLLLLILIIPVISQENRSNEINIKVIGIGNHIILNNYYFSCPDEIYINETKVGENKCSIITIAPETILRLVWFNKLSSCEDMFYNISNITEIDLTNFDSSNIVSTRGMFQYCNSLELINFHNFHTSKVTDMCNMFYNCTKL